MCNSEKKSFDLCISFLRECSSSLIIFKQSKINSSLTNKTMQQKNNKINKLNNLILYYQIQQCRMSINNLEMGL